MGWLEKIFGGSTHKISGGQYHGGYEGGQYHGGYDGGQYHSGHEGGQYHGGYEDSTIWDGPTTSMDALSDFDKEEIDRAIALSLAEEDQKGKKVIESEPNLEEDEALAKALQESLNVESPPPPPPRYDYGSLFPPVSYSFPYGYRVCAGCNAEIGHGRYLSCMGAVWHPECFRCQACNQPISDYEFSMSDNRPYHKSCYKEQHHPKCDVCKNFIPTNSAGLIEYRAHPFWLQKYCPSHENDGTPRCCSCERMEPVDARYLILDDGRKLCLECCDSAIMDTHECQPLYLEIQEFYEGLNMKGHHHMPETRGLCLSEEQTISTISKRPRIGGYRILDMFTEPYRLIRKCEVTAILILYGLPRLLTGSILAHEMMHAWLRLKGYPSLSPEAEEGICQVLAHMWLDSEIIAGSGSGSTSASSSSSSSPSTSTKKGKRSDFEKKLGDFLSTRLNQIPQQLMGMDSEKVIRQC